MPIDSQKYFLISEILFSHQFNQIPYKEMLFFKKLFFINYFSINQIQSKYFHTSTKRPKNRVLMIWRQSQVAGTECIGG